MQQLNSSPYTCWYSKETDYLEIEFKERVKFKNVILGFDIKSSESIYPIPELDDNGRSQPNIDGNKIHQNLQ